MRLIERCSPDVVMLQEVKGWLVDRLRDSWAGPVLAVTDHHPDAARNWITSFILLPDGSTVHNAGMVDGPPRPKRAIRCDVTLPALGRVHLVSWHNENAAKDQPRKMIAFRVMSDHLRRAPRPTILGADLNTWCDDVVLQAPDPDDVFHDEHAFMGAAPAHGLVDGWRRLLGTRGQLDGFTKGPSRDVVHDEEWRSPPLRSTPSVAGPRRSGRCLPAWRGLAAGSDHGLHWLDVVLLGH